MVEIECHLCGENFSPSKCVDTNDYDGEVKCPKCEAILHVKLVRGRLQKRKAVDRGKYWMLIHTADDLVEYNRRQQEIMERKQQIMEQEKKLLEEHSPKPPESKDDKPTKE